jgi:hypothetical protein
MAESTTPPIAARSSRRRKLWELPTSAHELLLGLALPPELLKRTLEHAVGRERGINFRIGGSEADVLFSVVHDMVARNCLSQALHRLLDSRYPLAVRQWAGLREPDELRAEFLKALDQSSGAQQLPALLWSALTHSCGADVQSDLIYAARAYVYQQLRQTLHVAAATSVWREERDRLVLALNDARSANAQAHAQGQWQRLADAAELAKLRGELARAQAVARALPAALPTSAAARPPESARPTAPPRPALTPALANPPMTCTKQRPRPAPMPPAVAGRTVLCVGGINGAVHRYRALIEARGGRFVHHDGGIEDNLQRLHKQLAQADLVLCQAACVNHEAYHCVKSHCQRSGTECVFIDRPSLSRFASVIGAVPTHALTSP